MSLNLHAIVRGAIQSVNSDVLVTIQVSNGSATLASGQRTPQYQTPVSFIGSVTGNVLNVSQIVGSGALAPAQTISDGGVLVPGTYIIDQIDGTSGGIGDYLISPGDQTVPSESMNSTLTAYAQIQGMSEGDLRQVEGLNLAGVIRKFYFYGAIANVLRQKEKGGDIIVVPSTSINAGTWLTTQVLEQWEGWCSLCAVLQNP